MAETLINQNQIKTGWDNPTDWPDMRNGAIPNSVYYFVGHSADYSTYPKFAPQGKNVGWDEYPNMEAALEAYGLVYDPLPSKEGVEE